MIKMFIPLLAQVHIKRLNDVPRGKLFMVKDRFAVYIKHSNSCKWHCTEIWGNNKGGQWWDTHNEHNEIECTIIECDLIQKK